MRTDLRTMYNVTHTEKHNSRQIYKFRSGRQNKSTVE